MNSDNKQPNENNIIQNNSSKMKKKIVIVIISIIAIMALMFISILVLDSVLDKIQEKQEEEGNNFNFYEADYDENIFEDTKYLSLIENGYIRYCDMDNVTLSIDEEDAEKYGEDISFMVSYIKHMINGDVDGYNECYSKLYYEEEKPKEKFTMQKIYDVVIKKISEVSVTDSNGTYTKYVFSLNYKILNNNGTLRNDFLDGTRTQYIYITTREGELKIDGITVLKNALK